MFKQGNWLLKASIGVEEVELKESVHQSRCAIQLDGLVKSKAVGVTVIAWQIWTHPAIEVW